MSKHTPTPWAVVSGTDICGELGGINAFNVKALDSDSWHVADCGDVSMTWTDKDSDGENIDCSMSTEEKEANARHIVHCVNNHERMYKALKSWMQILDAERLGLVCHSAKRVAEEEAKILFAELESSRDRE